MTREFPHRKYPCDECPIRADNTDNPKSQFPAERWRSLESSVRDPISGEHPGMDDPLFGCHKGRPGEPGEDLACAGWLARFGRDHVRIRLALALGDLPRDAIEAKDNWPPLHDTWEGVVAGHTSDTEGEIAS